MQRSFMKKLTIALLAITVITHVAGSDLDNKSTSVPPLPRPAADCVPLRAIRPLESQTSSVDESIQTNNSNKSVKYTATTNRAPTPQTPLTITTSNSCEQPQDHGFDSATSAAVMVALLNLVGKAEKEQIKDSGDPWRLLEKLAPVLEALIWALLIGFIAVRYDHPFARLLLRLGRRVERVHIKTPFGEVFADIGPQPEETQKSRAAEEASQLTPNDNASVGNTTPSGMPEFSKMTRSRAGIIKMYYEAEDFVIRSLQQEFNKSIAQNVQTSTGIEMDGFFVSQNTPYIIEVKMLRSHTALGSLRDALTRLIARLKQESRFENARVIMALVYVEELPHTRQRKIETELFRIEPTIQVRWFSLTELQRRFVGAADGSAN